MKKYSVSDIDRWAAAQHVAGAEYIEDIFVGKCDDGALVQAFAQHRTEAEKRFLDWLCEQPEKHVLRTRKNAILKNIHPCAS